MLILLFAIGFPSYKLASVEMHKSAFYTDDIACINCQKIQSTVIAFHRSKIINKKESFSNEARFGQ